MQRCVCCDAACSSDTCYINSHIHVHAGSQNRPEFAEIAKVYASITSQLKDYESRRITEWAAEIDASSEMKLRQPLLRRDKDGRLLHVNFDDALVRLLREVKYFLLLKLSVPATALTIYARAEQYRTQIGHLVEIVDMYNEVRHRHQMMTCVVSHVLCLLLGCACVSSCSCLSPPQMMETLHTVERPLVDKDLAHIDTTLERGIAVLNWQSGDVNEFITYSLTTVRGVYATVRVMKENLATIKKMM